MHFGCTEMPALPIGAYAVCVEGVDVLTLKESLPNSPNQVSLAQAAGCSESLKGYRSGQVEVESSFAGKKKNPDLATGAQPKERALCLKEPSPRE